MKVAKTKTLGSVISVSKGKKHLIVDKPSSSSKRLIGIDDLRNDNLLRYTDDSSGTAVVPDDVLIAWDGANAGTIGFGKKGYIGSTIARLRIDKNEKIYTPFLGVFLRSKFDYLRQTATGATIPHINRKALDDIALPEINFQDQIRIAHVLGKVEGLIAQRKQHLQQLDDLLKSVFLGMFGDPIRNEKGWGLTTIGELAREVKYGTSASSEANGHYKYLRMNNITQDGYWNFENMKYIDLDEKEYEKYALKNGDLVFNRTNSKELVGKTAVYDRDEAVVIAGYLIRVRFDEQTSPWFVWGHLNSKFGKTRLFNLCRNIVGMANINAQELRAIPILKAPTDLQNRFADIVQKVGEIKSRYQNSLSELESLYGTLSQQAFKGELNLTRVLLTNIQPAKILLTEPSETQPLTSTPQSIELPNTKFLLEALNNPKESENLMYFWLESYCIQLGAAKFTAQGFMDVAQKHLNDELQAIMDDKSVSTKQKEKLAELYPNNEFVLTSKDYDTIKKWIFDQLGSASLKQTRNTVIANNKRQFGNEILLRPRMNKKQ